MTMSSMYVGSNGLVIATCTRTRLRKYSTPRLRMAGELSTALHCGMLLHGVQLFHGAGFLSTAHTDADLDRTVTALDAVVGDLQAEGLL